MGLGSRGPGTVMRFDFDTVVDRGGTWAAKWDFTMGAHGQPPPAEHFAAEGPPPIAMSTADMEFPAPPCAIEAMRDRIDHGVFGYTTESDDYREAVARWQAERHGWTIDPDWVLTHNGVLPALFLAMRRFVPRGSGVILLTPAFPPFFDAVTINGCRVVALEMPCMDGRYGIDAEAFEAACARPDTRLFILCNPHNPVGRCFTADELGLMAELCARHDVTVFADEIHGDLIQPGHRLTPFQSVRGENGPKTIVSNGLSKTMNLAGLHLCNVIVPDAGMRAAYAEASLSDGNWGLNPVSKAAHMAGYREGGPWLDALLDYVAGNMALVRDACAERLPELEPIAAEGTYLQWIDMRGTGLDEAALMERILEKARLQVEVGSGFGAGGDGHIRINLACSRSMAAEAMERLARALRAND